MRASLPPSVVSLLEEPPAVHPAPWCGGCLDLLEPILDLVQAELGPGAVRVLETGAGLSTLAFLGMGWQVTSVAPDAELGDRISASAGDLGIDLAGWDYISARSEAALPGLRGRAFDVALMDGGRGWPTVFVDFCYLNATLRRGGLLVIDDAHLHSVRELVDLLGSQPGFQAVRDVTHLRAFRKETDSEFLPDAEHQPYLIGRSRGPSPDPRASHMRPPLTSAQALVRRQEVLAESAAMMSAGRLAAARSRLQELVTLDVDDGVLRESDEWLRSFAGDRRIVASTDPLREPAADEVVVIYGNYPLGFDNVVSNNPVKRHVSDYWTLPHDVEEHDDRWSGVDQIYIINLDDRPDRFDAVLRELALARAPLDRVQRISAIQADPADGPAVGGHVACLRSHLHVIREIVESQWRNALVLEDDFVFTSDLEVHLGDLAAFLERDYDYWICLIATLNEGPIIPLDDLVAESHQVVTTAAGYLVSAEGAERLAGVFGDALPRLISTGEEVYAADRSWVVLQQPGRFLTFRRKFGFQAASVSDIDGSVTRYRF